MFDTLKDKVSSVGDKIDDTGITRKAASAATGKRVIDAEKLADTFEALELELIAADVDREVAENIIDETRDSVDGATVGLTDSPSAFVQDAIQDAIEATLAEYTWSLDEHIQSTESPVCLLFVGVNGVGKTTTIAKLARRYQDQGLGVVIANGDTFRAAAQEQIADHADAVDTRLISHERGGDPTAVIYDAVEFAEANDKDVVLADTAGRLHNDEGLMNQLDKIERVVDPEYTIFVDQATAGQDAISRAQGFNDITDADTSIMTKVDATDTGGAILSIPHATDIPLSFLGTGQSYDDLSELDASSLAAQIATDSE